MGEVIPLPGGHRFRLRQVHLYGGAAGIDVALFTDAETGTVAPLRLSLVGPAPIGLETLAVLPHSDDGRAEADVIAAAVLRTLQLVDHPEDPREGAA